MTGDPPTFGMVWNDLYGWVPRDSAPQPFIPQGCICPPTSERTCESISCPRKNPFKNSISGATT